MFSSSMLPGLALTVGSTLAQSAAASQAASARSSALQAERTRQKALEQKQSALSSENQQDFATFQGDQDQRTADLTSYYQEPVAADANAEAGTVAPQGTSSITTRELAKQSEKATDKTNQQAASLAALRSFGDLMGDKMRGVQRNSSEIDQLTGFRKGSSDALASELDAASQKGAGMSLLGDVLGGLGSIATNYGALKSASGQGLTKAIGGLTGKKSIL